MFETRDEARRIAANVAKLPEKIKKAVDPTADHYEAWQGNERGEPLPRRLGQVRESKG
jgi:hypothetical protein